MKIRTQLLLANFISIGVIWIFLLISYIKMVLPAQTIPILLLVTVFAGLLSAVVHFFLTKPILKSIQAISAEAKKIREGNFNGAVEESKVIELKEMAASFNEMNRQLQKSFSNLQKSEASRKELVANISHDLRTPLASIQAFVEALQDGIATDKETFHKYLHTLRLETERLSSLIDELFQLSQLESGAMVLKKQRYYLDQLLLETLQNQLFQIEKKKLDIDVDLPEHLKPVYISPEKMKQAIINLLENAIRYSPIGGSIRISARENENGFIKVNIRDEGEGIPEEDLPYIFERLYRVEKSRNKKSGGSGLGLAIAKSIIELHSGEIGATRHSERGSTLWFTLPKAEVKKT